MWDHFALHEMSRSRDGYLQSVNTPSPHKYTVFATKWHMNNKQVTSFARQEFHEINFSYLFTFYQEIKEKGADLHKSLQIHAFKVGHAICTQHMKYTMLTSSWSVVKMPMVRKWMKTYSHILRHAQDAFKWSDNFKHATDDSTGIVNATCSKAVLTFSLCKQ